MKPVIIAFLAFLITNSHAQQKLIVHQSDNQLYVDHKVAPKENWYSVGRIYFISPKDIAAFNQLSMDKGLGIGQVLKIPLKDENFSQVANVPNAGARVIHVVQQKEGLLKVSNLYRVDKELLKKWNGLKTDQINVGASLTVGFLLPKSPVATAIPVQPNEKAVASIAVATNNSQKEFADTEKPKQSKPATPAVTVAAADIPVLKPSAAPVKVVEEQQSVVSTETKTRPQTQQPAEGMHPKGYFASLFDQQSKEGQQQKLENSAYGVFKSTSGWKDGKYYVLMNNVVPGTVVKLIIKSTRKEIFAKVLGAVPPGKESEGLALRMSNATVSALGAAENGSDVDLVWYN